MVVSLAAALPSPQDIDMSMVLDTPDPTYSEAVGVAAQTISYDTGSLIADATSGVSSVSIAPSDVLSQTVIVSAAKRAAATVSTTCLPQPTGASSAPTYPSNADNAANFLANNYYANVAQAAATPSGYTVAFTNQQASSQG